MIKKYIYWILFFILYLTGLELRTHHEHAVYEVPDRGRMLVEPGKFWREEGDGYV